MIDPFIMDPLSVPKPTPVFEPVPPLPPTKKSLPVLWILVIMFLLTLAGLLIYQQWQIQTLLKTKPTKTSEETPALSTDPTANWKTYTDEVLGIEYKLPQRFGLLEASGKEIPGDTGSQYCLIFMGAQSFRFVRRVYAGSGPCAGGDLVIGATTKDYGAGREGGFGDLQGYVSENNAYSARFVNDGRFALSADVASEITNKNGVTYLKVIGKNTLQNSAGEQMNVPVLGTPGEGNLGALINITNEKYTGFNIQMKKISADDEILFDQILSTFKFKGN